LGPGAFAFLKSLQIRKVLAQLHQLFLSDRPLLFNVPLKSLTLFEPLDIILIARRQEDQLVDALSISEGA